MRNPARWRKVGILVVISGLASAATILVPDSVLGTTPKSLLFGYALTAIIFGTMWTAWRHADAAAQSALLRGQDILVRWRVDPTAWRRFASLNDTFSVNELPVRLDVPAAGVDIIVGRWAVLIDGHIFRLHWGLQERGAPYSGGNWIVESASLLPGDPSCVNLRVRVAHARGTPVSSNLVFPIAIGSEDAARRCIPWTR